MAIDSGVKSLIKRSRMRVFRRLYMKRRNSNGDYETEWQRIENRLIKKWGNVSFGASNVKVNFWKYTGFSFELINEGGFFNQVDDPDSFFFDKKSVYKTLVKVEAGYIDDDEIEYPASPEIFYGIIGEGFNYTDQGTLRVQTDHVSKVLDDFPASQISGLGATQTASNIVEKIRDHQDSNNVFIFRKFINNWEIETTTSDYNIATSTSLQGTSAWNLIVNLADAENKQIYIDESGKLIFKAQNLTSTVIWNFSGLNDRDPSFGKTVIQRVRIDQNIKEVYNRIRVQFDQEETSTSFFVLDEDWTWGDGSSSDLYGVRTYDYVNFFITSIEAETIANELYDKYKNPQKKVLIQTKFIPGIKIDDRVGLTHRTGSFVGGSLYGSAIYSNTTTATEGYGIYGQYDKGPGIDINNSEFSIKKISHNIENFTTNLTLLEA